MTQIPVFNHLVLFCLLSKILHRDLARHPQSTVDDKSVVCNPKPHVVSLAFPTFVDDHFETRIRYTVDDGSDPRIRVPRVILLPF